MNHTSRTSNLRQMLTNKRRETLNNTGRAGVGALPHAGTGLALVQTSARAVARLDDALVQLDSGMYGSCLECAREISEKRLCVAPFAVRCQTCEDRRQWQGGGRP